MSIFEIRIYNIKHGNMEEWVQFMEEKVVPFIKARGMTVDAMFKHIENPSTFIWIRRFDNESHRQELYKAVYESEEWQTDFKPNVRRMVDVENAVVHLVSPTNASQLK